MITIRLEKDTVIFKGHANNDGKEDIVCASVSAIMYTTINAIANFYDDAIEVSDDGYTLIIKKVKDDKITNTLMGNMLALLRELADEYPKKIKLEGEK